MGGWVGGWVVGKGEEIKAVGMGCCGLGMGGCVGGWERPLVTVALSNRLVLLYKLNHKGMWVGAWVGGWVGGWDVPIDQPLVHAGPVVVLLMRVPPTHPPNPSIQQRVRSASFPSIQPNHPPTHPPTYSPINQPLVHARPVIVLLMHPKHHLEVLGVRIELVVVGEGMVGVRVL